MNLAFRFLQCASGGSAGPRPRQARWRRAPEAPPRRRDSPSQSPPDPRQESCRDLSRKLHPTRGPRFRSRPAPDRRLVLLTRSPPQTNPSKRCASAGRQLSLTSVVWHRSCPLRSRVPTPTGKRTGENAMSDPPVVIVINTNPDLVELLKDRIEAAGLVVLVMHVAEIRAGLDVGSV